MFFGWQRKKQAGSDTMKFLVAGLGNIGEEYENTRHNAGFAVADALVNELKGTWKTERLAAVSKVRFKGKTLTVIKPTTYMNLSGKAVKYWMDKEKIGTANLLVVVDDIALPLGILRMKAKGGDAGHNGLSDITARLGTDAFPRLRVGIGDDFPKGYQSDYVLGKWTISEKDILLPKIDMAVDMVKSFAIAGIGPTMTVFNNK